MAVGAGAGKHAPSCLTLLLLLLATDVASFSDKPRAPPLRPMQDLLQRLEFDTLLAKEGFEFFYREAQEPCKVGARWTDANDKINGTERSLVKALPQHRFAFVTWGPAGAGRVVRGRSRPPTCLCVFSAASEQQQQQRRRRRRQQRRRRQRSSQ